MLDFANTLNDIHRWATADVWDKGDLPHLFTWNDFEKAGVSEHVDAFTAHLKTMQIAAFVIGALSVIFALVFLAGVTALNPLIGLAGAGVLVATAADTIRLATYTGRLYTALDAIKAIKNSNNVFDKDNLPALDHDIANTRRLINELMFMQIMGWKV